MKNILFAVLALACILPACRKIGGSHAINQIWKLDNIDYLDSAVVDVPPASLPVITLDLSSGSVFEGQGPVNTYNGSYKALKDGQLEMTIATLSTMVGDSLSNSWETTYLEALRNAYFFDVNSAETGLSVSFEYGASEEGELNFSLQ